MAHKRLDPDLDIPSRYGKKEVNTEVFAAHIVKQKAAPV